MYGKITSMEWEMRKRNKKNAKRVEKRKKRKGMKMGDEKNLIMRCVRLWCHYGAHKFSRLVNCFKKNDSLCFRGKVLGKSLKNRINYFLLSSFEFWGRMSRDWWVIMHSCQVFLIFWELIYAILRWKWKKISFKLRIIIFICLKIFHRFSQ